MECDGQPSSLCPTLYLWYEKEKFKGSLSTHVDDDLMHFDPERRSKYTNIFQKRLLYGK